MTRFNRRTYSIGPFKRELFGIAREAPLLASAIGGISPALQEKIPLRVHGLDPAFRERIMLAVTGVNDCRYCRFVHTRIGRVVGIKPTEAAAILAGDFTGVPDYDRPALEFARRWAERNGETDPSEEATLVETYGRPTADQIEMSCRFIRLMNLSGNTFDLLLFSASGGRIGA